MATETYYVDYKPVKETILALAAAGLPTHDEDGRPSLEHWMTMRLERKFPHLRNDIMIAVMAETIAAIREEFSLQPQG